ncbi:MAG TPA: hypothetical protein VGM53_15325 [Streptosporangiaceae bacterium]
MRRFPAAALVTAVALSGVALAGGGAAAAHAGGPGAAAPGTISTVAGGIGGPDQGTQVAVVSECGVSAGTSSVFVAGGPVRQISARTGRMTPLTSYGTGGPFSGGGLAAGTPVDACGVAVDHSGNLVIADNRYHRIQVIARRTGRFYRRAMTAGHLYTVAGNGTMGSSGDGGPASKAEFWLPSSVAVDAAGNLVIADEGTSEIRVVAARTGTFYGQPMTAGDVYAIDKDGGAGVAMDPAGNVLIAQGSTRINVVAGSTGTFYGQPMTAGGQYTIAGSGTSGFAGDGGPATAAELNDPEGVAVDPAGNVLIADFLNYRVRVIAARTGTFYGQPMTAGDIYTIAGTGHAGSAGDGGLATAARLDLPWDVTTDPAGNLLIATQGTRSVRVVAAGTGTFYGQPMTAGDIYTIAGNGRAESGIGGLATSAMLGRPAGVTADAAGDMMITDGVRVRLVAASTGTLFGQAVTAGHIYAVAGNGVAGFSGDGGPATAASIDPPQDTAADAAGNLLIADAGNNRIRVAAASTGTFYGQAMTAGDIYTIAGNGTAGSAGDGGLATAAELNDPAGVTVDGSGNVVIADTRNNRIQVVAGSSGTFYGQAMTAGHMYTVASNSTPSLAYLLGPTDVRVDAAGNLVFLSGHFIRVIAESAGTFYGRPWKAGQLRAVAGEDTHRVNKSGVPANQDRLIGADALAIDPTGNLVITDRFTNQVDVVADSTATFYGLPMTAGDIYIITTRGRNHSGVWGDGGPSTKAGISQPDGVAVDAAGNLLIADTFNGRVREIAG